MAYSSGATPFHHQSAANTNPTSVLARRGKLEQVIAINTTATIYYLKFYDKASPPVVGTDSVAFMVPIPGATGGAGVVIAFPNGVEFTNGIAFALTGGILDNDATNAATGVLVELFTR
jgi:hypothetical protein